MRGEQKVNLVAEGFMPLVEPPPMEGGERFVFFKGPSIEEGGKFIPRAELILGAGKRFSFFEGPSIEKGGGFVPLAFSTDH